MTEQPVKPMPEAWQWVKVEGPSMDGPAKSVAEWTLEGPDVLCRYWYDKAPSDHARLIANAPETAAERDRLVGLNRKLIKTLEHISKARRFINGMVFDPCPDHLAYACDTIDVAVAALEGARLDEARKPPTTDEASIGRPEGAGG